MFSFLQTLRIFAALSGLFLISNMPMMAQQAGHWYKGNLHTHSFWSDGDDFPEMIMHWYKSHGYHFVALSDHNILAQGTKWVKLWQEEDLAVFEKCLQKFGERWVEYLRNGDTITVRLKTFNQYRPAFEEAGKFMILQSEEITDRFEGKPIHINATNVQELIPPQGGSSVTEVMQRNIDAVWEQRARSGQPMFPHINHPNFGWAITAEDLFPLQRERFFEVYNGHPAVHNQGDAQHSSTETMWDEVLKHYLLNGKPPMWGLAVDDSHNYRETGSHLSNPGRGWVMVYAHELKPASVVRALEAGDFYSSTGVTLSRIRRNQKRYRIWVAAREGVNYTIQFIGLGPDGTPQVLAEVQDIKATYKIKGNEGFVRAKIISDKPKQNPIWEGEVEVAWTQPVFLRE